MDEMQYYIQQHQMVHEDPKQFRGRALTAHITAIDELMRQHCCDSVLDYGCGKAQCWPTQWHRRITGYDPSYAPHATRPTGTYDMVICIDVLEHVPESAVDWVIGDVFAYRARWAYINIATTRSDHCLPDGTNKHVTVRDRHWWDQRLQPYDRYTVVYHEG
jgi:hypothetical protein